MQQVHKLNFCTHLTFVFNLYFSAMLAFKLPLSILQSFVRTVHILAVQLFLSTIQYVARDTWGPRSTKTTKGTVTFISLGFIVPCLIGHSISVAAGHGVKKKDRRQDRTGF